MRYYNILIRDSSGKSIKQWTSLVNGQTDPGALDLELNIPTGVGAIPIGVPYIRIWGISLQDTVAAASWNPPPGKTGCTIEVYGGMQKGLPLANPAQAGLLAKGWIVQAFANWIGTDMTLDIYFAALPPLEGPTALSGAWEANTPLADYIKQVLQRNYPDNPVDVTGISHNIVLANIEPMIVTSYTQFCSYIKNISLKILGGQSTTYPGVNIFVKADGTIVATDQSIQSKSTEVSFIDLVGQPTWLGIYQVNLTCVLRADVQVASFIRLPQTQFTTNFNSYSNFRDKSAIQGDYFVNSIIHSGRFRAPSAQAWVTSIIASKQIPPVGPPVSTTGRATGPL